MENLPTLFENKQEEIMLRMNIIDRRSRNNEQANDERRHKLYSSQSIAWLALRLPKNCMKQEKSHEDYGTYRIQFFILKNNLYLSILTSGLIKVSVFRIRRAFGIRIESV